MQKMHDYEPHLPLRPTLAGGALPRKARLGTDRPDQEDQGRGPLAMMTRTGVSGNKAEAGFPL